MADNKAPAAPASKATTFVFTNTSARLYRIAGQKVLPGKQSEPITDPKIIEAVKKSPGFRSKELQEGNVDMPAPVVPNLEKLTVEQAGKLISVEDNLGVLQAWVKSEKRPEVLALINKRVEALP